MTYRPKKSWDFSNCIYGELQSAIKFRELENLCGNESREELVQILMDHGIDAYQLKEISAERQAEIDKSLREYRAPKRYNQTTGTWKTAAEYRQYVEIGGAYPFNASAAANRGER